MSGNLQFTPLYGVHSEDPLCYLLEVDTVKFLLDCGWNEKFDPSVLEPLREIAPEINYVLISFPDLEHMGALPYAVKHFGLDAQIYTTTPNVRLGQLYLYDVYYSKISQSKFDLFDLDDVDKAFDKCVHLTSGQRLRLDVRATNVEIEIEPIKCGRIVGGAMWRIRRDPDVILYAVDYNHGSDELLSGAQFPTGIEKPTLLITDTYNFQQQSDKKKRKAKVQHFTQQIVATLRNNGNVLIPIDSAGRVLELLVILNRYWGANKMSYPLIFLSRVSSSVDYVSQHLEWLKKDVTDDFDKTRTNPLHLENVIVMDNTEDLATIVKPKVILTSTGSMEFGFARQLFSEWAATPENMIILTDRGMVKNSLSRKLIEKPSKLELVMESWVNLEGAELRRWLREKTLREDEEERRKKQKEAELALQEMTGNSLEDIAPEETDSNQENNDSENVITKTTRHSKMFTVAEPERNFTWGEYGEESTEFGAVAEFKTLRDVPQLPPQTTPGDSTDIVNEVKELTALEKMVLEDESKKSDLPRKSATNTIEIEILCKIEYIDMEGRSNCSSIKRVIQSMAPKKIILVHGPPEPTEAMHTFCNNMQLQYGVATEPFVKTPKQNECIDITSDTNVFKVILSKEFFDDDNTTKSLKEGVQFSTVGEYQVAYFDGILNHNEEAVTKKAKLSHRLPTFEPTSLMDDKLAEYMMEDSVQNEMAPLFLKSSSGLRLVDLKTVLTSHGFETEFVDGKFLVCNKEITIFLPKSGHVELGGPLTDEFYKIRSLVYSQFTLV